MKNTAKVAALSIVKNNPQSRGIFQPGFKKNALIAALSLALSSMAAHAGPSGGQISTGSGSISQSGLTTNITQQTKNLAINWNNFNVNADETVNFAQPSASSIVVNRVLNQNPSKILGNVNANGQVYVINPSGVVFGKGAQVNVGSLVASTQNLTDANLNAGNITFSGNSTNDVTNQGSINAANGGFVALIGSQVSNEGFVNATSGTALLAAGNQVSLTLNNGSLISYNIDQGAASAISGNTGTITADGGKVLLSAQAANNLSSAVVNNSGLLQARTLQNVGGVIKLMGDMGVGSVKVDGNIDVSAPNGGDGGFVETSAAHVNVADTARVSSLSASGKNGEWLIDPVDFNVGIKVDSGYYSNSDMAGVTLSNALAGGAVTIQSNTGKPLIIGNGVGDININEIVNWSANKLTLIAQNNININENMIGTGTAKLDLQYSGDGIGLKSGKKVNLPSGLNYSEKDRWSNVTNFTVINSLGVAGSTTGTDLQGMIPGNNYVLGSDIDATATSTWNAGSGFKPTNSYFKKFDGLGHSITNLVINRPLDNVVGLFISNNGLISNVNLNGGSITGGNTVGALVGVNSGGVSNNTSSAAVKSTHSLGANIGGLVGMSFGWLYGNKITGSSITFSSTGNAYSINIGGLVGYSSGGSINNTVFSNISVSSTGTINSQISAGGLIGNASGTVLNSVSSGAINNTISSLTSYTGGLIGLSYANVEKSHVEFGTISGQNNTGGLIGNNLGTVSSCYADISVFGGNVAGGLVGLNDGNISQSFTAGTVAGINDIGGFAGVNSGDINNNASSANVTSTTGGASGFVNSNINAGKLFYNFSSGTLQTTSGKTSGFSNSAAINTNFSGNYWNSTSAPITSVSGTGLTSVKMLQKINFAGFDQANIWLQYEGLTAPLLRSLLETVVITPIITSKIYDGTATIAPFSSMYAFTTKSNLPLPIDATFFAGNLTTAPITAINAGRYSIVASGLYPLQQINGFIPEFNPGTYLIEKAPLTISGLAATNRPYNGSRAIALTGKAVLNGLMPNETMNINNIDFSYIDINGNTNVSNFVNSTTEANISNGSNGLASNYNLMQSSFVSAITPASINIAGLSGVDRPYNGTTNVTLTGTPAIEGIVKGENLILGNSLSAISVSRDAGLQSIMTSFTIANGTNGLASNYIVNQTNQPPVLITPAPLTITGLAGVDRAYNGTTIVGHMGTASIAGLVAGETISLTGIDQIDIADKNVGQVLSFKSFGIADLTGKASNYFTIPSKSGSSPTNPIPFYITPKNLIVSGLSAVSRPFDAANSTVNLSGVPIFQGLNAGEDPGFSLSGNIAVNMITGVQAVVANIKLANNGNFLATNYTLTQPSIANVDISATALTVTGLSALSRPYDGSTIISLSGVPKIAGVVKAGDTIAIQNALTGTLNNKDAGLRSISTNISLLVNGAASTYTFIQPYIPLVYITPVPLTITGLSGIPRAYNGTYSVGISGVPQINGQIIGENLTISNLLSINGILTDKNAGSRTGKANVILASSASANINNYNLTQPAINATITPVALTISGISSSDRLYDGTNVLSLTGAPILNGLTGSDKFGVIGRGLLASANAGNQTVSTAYSLVANTGDPVEDAALLKDYTLTQLQLSPVNIIQKDVFISGLTAKPRDYDGTNVVFLTGQSTISGMIGTETLNAINLSGGTISDKNVGLRMAYSNAVLTNGTNGGLAKNYHLVPPLLQSVQISPLKLTVTGLKSIDKIFNGKENAPLVGTPVIPEIIAGESFNINNATNGLFYNTSQAGGFFTPAPGQVLVYSDVIDNWLSNKNIGNWPIVTNISISDKNVSIDDRNGFSSNYILTQPTIVNANITPAPITIKGLVPVNRDYDGTNKVVLDTINSRMIGTFNYDYIPLLNDTSGIADIKNIGSQKVTYDGTIDANLMLSMMAPGEKINYYIDKKNIFIPNVTITPKPVTISGLAGNDFTYNGKNTAKLTGTALINGLIGTETLTLKNTAIATVNNIHVGTRSLSTNIVLANGTLGGLAANYQLTQPVLPNIIINPAPLTFANLRSINRPYDGTSIAKFANAPMIKGLIFGESLLIGNIIQGTAASPNAGIQKVTSAITIADISGKGFASDYLLTQPSIGDINISRVPLLISGLAAASRVYDGTVNALFSGTAKLNGLVNNETLTLINSNGAVIKRPNVGKNKAVSSATLSDGTGLAANYILKKFSDNITVTPAQITVTGLSMVDHTYNGNTKENLIGNPILSGQVGLETLGLSGYSSGKLTSADVGSRSVTTKLRLVSQTGSANNYQLIQPNITPVNITPATLTIINMAGVPRAYNGTTAIKLARWTIKGIQSHQRILLTGYETAKLSSQNAGLQSIIDVNLSLVVPNLNYNLIQPILPQVNISPAKLTLSGLSVTPKIADGTTSMILKGNPVLKGLIGLEQLTISNANVGVANVATAGRVTVTPSLTLTDGSGLVNNYNFIVPTLQGTIK
jgi:filamentous hemagglutinin family protein